MGVRVTVRVNIDQSKVNELTSAGGLIDQKTARAAGKVRDEAKRIIVSEGRVDTGAMMQGVKRERSSSSPPGVSTWIISSDEPYSKYQHDGTRGPIVPRRAKVLRFRVGGKTVYARKVRGISGIKFLTRALDKVSPNDWQ